MGERTSTIRLTVADNFSAQLRAFSQAVDNAEKQTKELGAAAKTTTTSTGGMMSKLGGLAGGLGVPLGLGGIAAAIIGVGAASIKLGMDMEQTKMAFTTLLGSSDAAKKHLEELRDFAATTPFQFNDLTAASQKLQAMGFEAKNVIPMLTDLGDAASAMGAGGAEKIDRMVLALGQMQAKGKVSAQEMNQLTEANIPGWRYLSEAMGMTTAEVMKLSEKGLLPADAAIQAILKGMREDFGGMMAKQAETAAGQVSNLTDALMRFGTVLGEVANPSIKEGAKGIAGYVNVMAMQIEMVKKGTLSLGDMWMMNEKVQFGVMTLDQVYDELIQREKVATIVTGMLNDENADARDRMRDLTVTVHENTDKFIANIAAQTQAANATQLLSFGMRDLNEQLLFQIASEGMDTQAKIALAQSMGLMNEQTVATIGQVQTLRAEMEAGTINAQQYEGAIAGLGAALGGLPSVTQIKLIVETLTQQGNLDYAALAASAPYSPPPHAIGGTLRAGEPTMVHKDEVIIPGADSYAMSRAQMAGNSFGNIMVDARGSTLSAAQIRAAVKRALDEAGNQADAYRRTGGVN